MSETPEEPDPEAPATTQSSLRTTYHFFPPGVDEQRAFFVQLGGALLSCAVIGVLAWRTTEATLRGVLLGAGVGVLFLLVRAAWQLEQKAARAQNGEIAVGENGFSHTDLKGRCSFVSWDKIEALEVRGGRLQLAWRDEKNRKCQLRIGAREIENGMELIRLLAARGQRTSVTAASSNFIPLEPK
jgi:hypothetical protein